MLLSLLSVFGVSFAALTVKYGISDPGGDPAQGGGVTDPPSRGGHLGGSLISSKGRGSLTKGVTYLRGADLADHPRFVIGDAGEM